MLKFEGYQFSIFFKGALLGLDVSKGGGCVKCGTFCEGVCGACCGVLEYRLWCGVLICGDERAY